MKKSDLIKLGFKETSYIEEEIHFTEFTLETESFVIQVSGIDDVEIKIDDNWIDVPNCKTINQLKQLIKLFS